ncbi:methyl-accepting chemotaxis protein [Peptococcaceae bacterium 1198_IL3148]
MFKSIRTKLVIIITLTMLVSLSSVVLISSSLMADDLKFKINQDNQSLNDALKADITLFMKNNINIVNSVAETEMMKNVDEPKIMDLFEGIIKSNPDILKIYYGFPEEARLVGYPVHDMAPDYDSRQRPWYIEAVAQDQMIITDVYIAKATQKPVVTVATPIKGDDGSLKAVLAIDIALDTITEFVKSNSSSGTGYSFITDNLGVVIAHPDNQLIEKQEKFDQYDFVKKALNGGSGYQSANFDGEERLVAYSNMDLTGWGVFSQQSQAEAYQQVEKLTSISFFVGLVVLVLSIIVTILVINRTTKAIKEVTYGAQELASGNLNVNIEATGKDEVGLLAVSFNTMARQLRELVDKVVVAADRLATSSEQIASSSEQINNGATDTATTINEMASGIASVTENVQHVAGSAKDASDKAQKGQEKMAEMTEQVNVLVESTKVVGESVQKMNERTQNIGQIVDIITQIAGQTNLLALNAAIEAARAGDAGKGFAVVADEVRKLAAQSANAAKDIQQMISDIQDVANTTVQTMEEEAATIRHAVQVASDTSAMFTEITSINNGLAEKVEQAAAAVEQMSAGIQNMAAVAEEQSAISDQTNAAIQQLTTMTQELKLAVNNFKIEENHDVTSAEDVDSN